MSNQRFLTEPRTEWKVFIDLLKADISLHHKQIEKEKSGFERWSLFINPFARLDTITTMLEGKIKDLDLVEPPAVILSELPTEAEVEALTAMRQKYVSELYQAQVLGLSMRMIVPVFVEAFVNLVLFLLAKKEVRNDKRVYQSALRSQIDVRVKSLPLYCDGFAEQVDGSKEEFKGFCRLMDYRNELLHGNIDPTKLVFDEVFFDNGTIPLFSDATGLFHRLMSNSIRFVEPEAALGDLETARRFIDYMLSRLDARCREEVESVMRHVNLGWRKDGKGRVGVLFSDTIVEGIAFSSEEGSD